MRSTLIDYKEQEGFSAMIKNQMQKIQVSIDALSKDTDEQILKVIQDLRIRHRSLMRISTHILEMNSDTFQNNKASILDALSGDNSVHTALQKSSLFNTNIDLIYEFSEQTQQYFESISFYKVNSLQSLGSVALSNAASVVRDEIMAFMSAYQIPLKKEAICLNQDQESSIHLLLTTPWSKLDCPEGLKAFFLFCKEEIKRKTKKKISCENLKQLFSLEKNDPRYCLENLFLEYEFDYPARNTEKILLQYLLRHGVKLTHHSTNQEHHD